MPSENKSTSSPASSSGSAAPKPRYVLFAVLTIASFILDMATKVWALKTLERHGPGSVTFPTPIHLSDAFSFVLARNYGGAWGLLRTADDAVRKPFFVVVTLVAIVFILYLYRRVQPQQHALQWGLPLVLGGAVGNLADRIRLGWVVDFIDYKASWVHGLNGLLARLGGSDPSRVSNHWPTFNVADIAITVGVILMAVDMFIGHRHAAPNDEPDTQNATDEQAPEPSEQDPATETNS